MIKYTPSFLSKLENLITESDYVLRYEKGKFKSGHCLLHEQKVIMVHTFYTTEGKINALIEILQKIDLATHRFTDQSKCFYKTLCLEKISIKSST